MTKFIELHAHYHDFSRRNSYFIKSFVMGVVIYNLLGNIPLVNRAVCFFFVLGAIGAVPKVKNINHFVIMTVMIAYFIWRNYIHYAAASHSAYLPYHFIWE